MAKPMDKLGIMNLMGAAAHKKSRKVEGSPAEEASESPAEAKAEVGAKAPKQKAAIAINAARSKGPKVPKPA